MRSVADIQKDIDATADRLAMEFETPAPALKATLERLYAEMGSARRHTARSGQWQPCPGCVRRGVSKPASVRRGYQCSECANIEEGAY